MYVCVYLCMYIKTHQKVFLTAAMIMCEQQLCITLMRQYSDKENVFMRGPAGLETSETQGNTGISVYVFKHSFHMRGLFVTDNYKIIAFLI